AAARSALIIATYADACDASGNSACRSLANSTYGRTSRRSFSATTKSSVKNPIGMRGTHTTGEESQTGAAAIGMVVDYRTSRGSLLTAAHPTICIFRPTKRDFVRIYQCADDAEEGGRWAGIPTMMRTQIA